MFYALIILLFTLAIMSYNKYKKEKEDLELKESCLIYTIAFTLISFCLLLLDLLVRLGYA